MRSSISSVFTARRWTKISARGLKTRLSSSVPGWTGQPSTVSGCPELLLGHERLLLLVELPACRPALRFMVIFRIIEKIGARGPCDRARVAGKGVWFTTRGVFGSSAAAAERAPSSEQ